MAKTIKNVYTIQKLKRLSWLNTILQGNKKDISISNIINNMPTNTNFIVKGVLIFPKGSNPHSYIELFSESGFVSPILELPSVKDIEIKSKIMQSANSALKKIVLNSGFILYRENARRAKICN